MSQEADRLIANQRRRALEGGFDRPIDGTQEDRAGEDVSLRIGFRELPGHSASRWRIHCRPSVGSCRACRRGISRFSRNRTTSPPACSSIPDRESPILMGQILKHPGCLAPRIDDERLLPLQRSVQVFDGWKLRFLPAIA